MLGVAKSVSVAIFSERSLLLARVPGISNTHKRLVLCVPTD